MFCASVKPYGDHACRPTHHEVPPDRRGFEDGAVLRWRGRLGLSGLFDGEHELRVEATGPATSRFTQRETFRGVLVPLMGRILADTDAGFAAMNAALDARARRFPRHSPSRRDTNRDTNCRRLDVMEVASGGDGATLVA